MERYGEYITENRSNKPRQLLYRDDSARIDLRASPILILPIPMIPFPFIFLKWQDLGGLRGGGYRQRKNINTSLYPCVYADMYMPERTLQKQYIICMHMYSSVNCTVNDLYVP